MLLYSISSRWSFQDVSRTCRQIPLDTKEDPRLVLVLIGTKSDEKSTREVSAEEGIALAAGLGCKAFFETSAKTGENVDAAVFAMVQALRQADRDHSVRLMTPFKMIRNIPSLFRKD
jgi:GTPase SAR1 family protein